MHLLSVRMGVAAIVTALIGGCASTPPRGEYPILESSVDERTGFDTRQLSDEDKESETTLDEVIQARLQEPLTADAVVGIALLNNHAWRARYHRLGIAEADVIAAGLISNPSLGAVFRFPTSGSGTNVDLDIGQEIVELLMRPARRRLAADEFAEVQLRTAHAATDLAHHARTAYYTYAAAEAIRIEREQAFETADIALTLAKETAKAGNISALELARYETQLEEQRIALTEAKGAVQVSRESLNVIMGLRDQDPVWFLDMRPLPEPSYPLPELPVLAQTAVEHRLDLQAAGKEMETVAQALGLTRDWRLFASVEIGASAEREFDGEWSAGPSIAVEIPLFNRKQDEIRRLESMLRESEERFLDLTVEVAANVRQSYRLTADLENLIVSLREHLLPGKRRIVQLTQQEYNFMLVDTFHLLRAKEEEFEARADYFEALRDYWIALTDLERAIGGRLPKTDNGTIQAD